MLIKIPNKILGLIVLIFIITIATSTLLYNLIVEKPRISIKEKEIEEQIEIPEKEVQLENFQKISEYQIFSQQKSYRDVWQGSRIPIKTIVLPVDTILDKVEAKVRAYNRDPLNPRNIGIAIGPVIPDNCQAGYFLNVSPDTIEESSFLINPEWFSVGINKIAAWIAIEQEWGGKESWLSLELKIYYRGEAPKFLDELDIIEAPLDPINCKRAKVYINKKNNFSIEYPSDWTLYDWVEGGTLIDLFPPGLKPQLGSAIGIVAIHIQRKWWPEEITYEEYLDDIFEKYPELYLSKKEVIFGKGNYKAIEYREVIPAAGRIERTVDFVYDDLKLYTFKINEKDSQYMPIFENILASFQLLSKDR